MPSSSTEIDSAKVAHFLQLLGQRRATPCIEPNTVRTSSRVKTRCKPRTLVHRLISLSVMCAVLPTTFGCASESLTPTDEGTPVLASEQDVTFVSEGFALVGTLTLPARRSRERVPGVVLIAGSGPESRDEVLDGQFDMMFGFELPVLGLLAAGLTDAGFAVLRYDKRSCGTFNDCADNDYPLPPDSTTIEDYIADVGAALDRLEGEVAVDSSRVSVIGHSEGGSYLPTLLSTRGDLRSGVMLAGPYQPVDAVIAQQAQLLQQHLMEQGADAGTISQDLAPLDDELAALAMMRAGDYDGGSVGGAFPPFWLSLMALGDANPVTSALVERPILAIGGSYDWNVPPSELALWQQNFTSSSNPDDRAVVTLDCMTHALNCVAQPDYRLITSADIGQTLHPDLVPSIVSFLHDH
jgi:pimeloyl-ACP methyl ester carboxylesterase